MRRPKTANFDESWKNISRVTTAVMSESPVERDEWCEQITSVYYLCMAMPTPLAESLYNKLKEYLINHVQSCREQVLEASNGILPIYNSLYKTYFRGAGYLNDLYMHLNQHFTKRTIKNEWCDHYMHSIEKVKKFEKVQDLAMNIWRDEMIEKVHEPLVTAVLQDITRDRRGVSTYSNILRDVIHSFVEVQSHEDPLGSQLQLYKELFEERLLENTGNFYQKEAQKLYEQNDVSNYMIKVIEKLDEEELRLRKFIHHTSISPCKKECVNKLIADIQDRLLDEYKIMLKDEHVEDLSRLYILIRRLNEGCKKMADIFHDHIFENGKDSIELMARGCTPQEYVDALLVVYRKFTNIVSNNLSSDQNFTDALNRAMTKMVNSTGDTKKYPRSSELLVRHADHILRKGNKNSSLSEIEDQLRNFIDLFKYVEDKDLFQRFYSKKLANRLIHNTSVSIELEEVAISGLKDRCGYEYTSPLQRMLIDMKVSDDLTKEFDQHLEQKNEKFNVVFSVNILQSGAWPFSANAGVPEEQADKSTLDFNVPSDLAVCIDKFKTFYNKKYSGRRLRFVFPLSNGTVVLNHTPRQYTITMSVHQLAVLLLFNDKDSSTKAEITESLGLDKPELEKTLTTLVDSKLIKLESDNYTINTDYVNKKSKFKLPTSTVKDHAEKEVEQTHQSVEEDRRLYIQAAIVRTMKSRKQLGHNELIQQVINLSKDRFTPSVAMIKKCVEVLIDKQYLERHSNQKDVYQYLA